MPTDLPATTAGTGWPSGRSRDGGIDEIPLPDVPGRLWLCGKHAIGPDPQALLGRVGATSVVCLTEVAELVDRYPEYVAWLRAAHAEQAVWFPIPDLHAPEAGAAVALVDDLARRLRGGAQVVIHCAAGFGRSGTLATCVLIALGTGAADALALVAASRPMAGPEVGAQRDLVEAFAGHLADAARGD
jgi:protein-tyrosine phosphatase